MVSQSSTSSSTLQPPLLRLPAELRNKIFADVLTSPLPLRYQPPTSASNSTYSKPFLSQKGMLYDCKHGKDWTPTVEFNQLKFVKRQLYSETAGLELKFNTLLFTSHREPLGRCLSAEACFLDGFLPRLRSDRYAWLNTIIIQSDEKCLSIMQYIPPHMSRFVQLVGFCKQYPTISVRYQFANWDLHTGDAYPSLKFFSAGVALTAALQAPGKGEEAMQALLTGGQVWTRNLAAQAREWSTRCGLAGTLEGVGNLAFYPTVGIEEFEVFALDDEEEALHAGEDCMHQMRRYGESWIRNGINASDQIRSSGSAV